MTNKDCRKPRETHKKPSKATTVKRRLLKRIGTHSPAIVETKTKTAIISILLSNTTAKETEADGLHLLTTRGIDEAIAGRTTGTEIKLMTETIGRTLKGRIRHGTIVTKVVEMITIIGIGIKVKGGVGRIVAIEGTGGVGQGRGTDGTGGKEVVKEGVGLGKKLATLVASEGKGHQSRRLRKWRVRVSNQMYNYLIELQKLGDATRADGDDKIPTVVST